MTRFTLTPWTELGRDDLYDVMVLRQVVFAVEQNCAFLDCDGVDKKAWHVLGRADDALVAYARIVPPGVKYAEPSIGRVVTHPSVRRSGAGRALFGECIAHTRALFGGGPIRIGAQRYLERFYASFGFVATGEPYLEDNIPHIEMVLA
jgi:ElaA protein